MISSKYRGHKIKNENSIWKYCDTEEPVELSERDCGKCGLPSTKEDHDGCLDTLKYAKNACCGHGETGEAYFQFWNGFRLAGILAIVFIKVLKLWSSLADSSKSLFHTFTET